MSRVKNIDVPITKVVCKTTREMLHPSKDKLRQLYRSTFETIKDHNNQHYLTNHILTNIKTKITTITLRNKPDYFIKLRNAGVVISHRHADLYEIFARYRRQVGIFSTALYESLYFGTDCFVVNATGSEHMKNLINLDLACLIASPKDIDLNWQVDNQDLKKFFSQTSQKNISSIIF